MKTTFRLLLAVLVTATSQHLPAQPPANTTTARILGALPDGTPPLPTPFRYWPSEKVAERSGNPS